jgi:glycine/D-amino acid oxidase-like deaminating enzyme
MSTSDMADYYDVIVVGLGGHGAATVAYLSEQYKDLRVLGVEQFDLTHKNG